MLEEARAHVLYGILCRVSRLKRRVFVRISCRAAVWSRIGRVKRCRWEEVSGVNFIASGRPRTPFLALDRPEFRVACGAITIVLDAG